MRQELTLPFEKNRYFYGKLLSVEDFNLEQRYVEDKRRMMNRLINGTGIVTGLFVTIVDEQTISVEKGVALDGAGREIVIDTPVMKRLAMLDGFREYMEEEKTGPLYLCLVYDEKPAVPVHNIAKNVPDAEIGGETDYGRIREGYRLYLTSEEPWKENLSASGLYENVSTIYRDNGIRIRHRLTRYVKAGGTAVLTIEVENRDRRALSIRYTLLLRSLNWESVSRIPVKFDEILFEKTGRYELKFILTAPEVTEGTGIVTVDSDSLRVSLAGEEQMADAKVSMELQIGSMDEKEALIRSYYRLSMEEVLNMDQIQPVYLARLELVAAGGTYMLERLEPVPYGQYVRNLMLQQALDGMLLNGTNGAGPPLEGYSTDSDGTGRITVTNGGVLITGGSCVISLKAGGQKQETYYSEEITHGLGLGKTDILLALESGGETYFGDPDVFDRRKTAISLAARLDTHKGTFLIGIRIKAPVAEEALHIRWTALRNRKDTVVEQADRRILIRPNVLELKVRESRTLEAICENMAEKAVIWSVSLGGGDVDGNGLYTAPNLPGVYEVTVAAAAYPAVKASLFVVVREYTADNEEENGIDY